LDRLGYLGYYREYWNCLLQSEDHTHEPGEDTSECYNCIMDKMIDKLSAFELACWNWYAENVTPFSAEHGIVRDTFRETGLKGVMRKMCLAAFSAIAQTFSAIQADMIKQKKGA
jgi:hypothetical protein